MKTKYRFISLIGSLVCFGVGGNAYADMGAMPDELQENPSAIIKPEIPNLLSGFGSDFAMKFVAPDPDTDFKIGKVTVDPNIDYKIVLTGPESRKMLPGLNNRRGQIIRKKPWQR